MVIIANTYNRALDQVEHLCMLSTQFSQQPYEAGILFFHLKLKKKLIVLAALGLPCCVKTFCSCGEWASIAGASLVVERGL